MRVRDLYGQVRCGESVVVGEYSVIGYPKEARIRAAQLGEPSVGAAVTIGARCVVLNHVVVYEGTSIGEDCVVDDRVRIGYGCVLGDRVRVVHGAYMCDRVQVGDDACVAGFICDAAVVGARSTVMGELVHEYTRPDLGWWGTDEPAPVVEPDSVVGFGARVVGGIRIGPHSYVAAGSIVTKDVPPGHVVTGTNVRTPLENWTGVRLRSLIQEWTTAPRLTRRPR